MGEVKGSSTTCRSYRTYESYIADFHIHSRYSRATSKDMRLDVLHAWAQRKGISVVGTGDFTHPRWFEELREHLVPDGGLFRLRREVADEVDRSVPARCRRDVRFMLTAEISNIYKKAGRTRKVHNIIFARDFDAAARIIAALNKVGNIASDGRPILGLDSRDLLSIVLECGGDAFLVPAHAWTPHFSVLGAFSGFDSIEECFGDLTPHVFAIETGLSSDPAMNWRVSGLDRFALMSNSDAHSPDKLGREANLFEAEMSFDGIRRALETKEGLLGTIEFFPQEGKYHYDGHRACGTRLSPEETRRHGGLCPACGRKVTLGVYHRVCDLADRPEGSKPKDVAPFECLIPLQEVLAEVYGVGRGTRRVAEAYERLLSALGDELYILRLAPLEEIESVGIPGLAEAIGRVRSGRVHIEPGYDGEYGTIRIFDPAERSALSGQATLF